MYLYCGLFIFYDSTQYPKPAGSTVTSRSCALTVLDITTPPVDTDALVGKQARFFCIATGMDSSKPY